MSENHSAMAHNLKLGERVELMGLLFLHGTALATCFVPLGSVLDKVGLGSVKPWAFASSAIAALLSPLFFGAMADRLVAPARVLRWISLAAALSVTLVAWTLSHGAPGWVVWCAIQLQSIFSSPASSLTGSIVFSRLVGSQRQFGSIRALGTVGWMVGCWIISWMVLDISPNAFYLSGFLWMLVAGYTLILPHELVSAPASRLTLRERFGFDALSLLRDANHRVIFVTSALIAIPFAAFYPYTPQLLADLRFEKISAWMSVGQVTEVFALITISSVLQQYRMKWIIVAGIGFGVIRYVLYAYGTNATVLIGLALHGVAYTYTYVTIQIYLAQKIAAAWRTRAQALLSLMTSGVGNLAGYLLTGAWFRQCTTGSTTQWSTFWVGLSLFVVAVLVYFVVGAKERSISAADTKA